ncbi:microaggregate-binding protein 1 [Nocardia sp. NPDC055321]
MSERKSGPLEAVSGVVEGIKGKVKEVAGAVTGRDDLRREGSAQQDKGEAQRTVAQKEAEAEKARAAAAIDEQRQRAHQQDR